MLCEPIKLVTNQNCHRQIQKSEGYEKTCRRKDKHLFAHRKYSSMRSVTKYFSKQVFVRIESGDTRTYHTNVGINLAMDIDIRLQNLSTERKCSVRSRDEIKKEQGTYITIQNSVNALTD